MIAALLWLWLALAAPDSGATVRGQVRSAGHRTPISAATVRALAANGAWVREAMTDAGGNFVLQDLPGRDFTLKIVAREHVGFERATDPRYWSRRRPPVIYLQPSEAAGHYRTIVASERTPRAQVTAASLSPEEVRTLPGSQGDPLRALQNLPGVARVPGGLGLLVLRGAAPNQSQVFFGEHPIPRAFHTPSLASVVQGGVLSQVKYVPGNFDASYGNAVGGVVVMTPRHGRRDGVHGQIKLDVVSAAALVEGPWRRGSFIAAAQRGYLDLAMRAMKSVIGDNFLLPRFYDYQILVDQPIGAGATLTTRFLGAGDQLRYPTGSNDGDFELNSQFHRVDLALRKRIAAWDFLVAPAVRFDRNSGTSQFGLNRRSDVVGLLRAEIGVRPATRFHLTVGADTQIDRYTTHQYRPTLDFGDFDEVQDVASRGTTSNSGLYVTPTLELGRVRVVPAVRVSAFTGISSQAFAVDPRLLVRWAPHTRVALSIGAGLYSQPRVVYLRQAGSGLVSNAEDNAYAPLPGGGALVLPGVVRFLDARLEFDPAGRIGVSRSLQLSANLHLDLPRSLGLDATGFYVGQREGLPPMIAGTVLSSTGGFSTGVELLLRKELTRRLYGWIAYTWMHVERGNLDGWQLTNRRPSPFDQRHNFVALLGVKLPRRWEVGARFRVVTGLPYSPVVGAVFTGNPLSPTTPLFGATNSARMATFHQLDVRIDKTWVLRRSIVGAYLDVQNVYNRQNPEGLVFNEFFAQAATVVGVPILPVFGVRVEY